MTQIDKAFILAAGMGRRLRPYTDTMPKPMVPVAGKATIDHILDRLVEAGVKHVVVNLHYRADQLAAHLGREKRLTVQTVYEEDLLDTGGGIKAQLGVFGDQPFYIINGDAYWEDDGASALKRLAAAWDDTKMDLLLLLQDVKRMILTRGVGDYDLENGRPKRHKSQNGSLMFAGIRLCHPRLFKATPDGAFSFLQLMDKAEEQDRLSAIVHEGDWHHISTPEELDAVNRAAGHAAAERLHG